MNEELYKRCVEEVEKIENPEIKTTLLTLCKKTVEKKTIEKRDGKYGYFYMCCPECGLEICVGSKFCEHCGQALN